MVELLYSDKDIYEVYFNDLTQERLHPKWIDSKSQIICNCGKVLSKQSNGFTNGANHVKSQHQQDYPTVMQSHLQHKLDGQTSILSFISVPDKAKNMYAWLDWVVMDNHPFNFVEKKRVRKNVILTPICTSTLLKYLRLVTKAVEDVVKLKLPDKFGLIIDGWTENSVHFCVLFACVPGTCDRIMLSFSPLLNPTSQSAVAHSDWIVSILHLYDKDLSHLLFLCSDNTNSMPALSILLGCPFIGCHSHRLALYVRKYLNCDKADSEHIINKLKVLMQQLRSANKASALLMEIQLKPITSNATRWSSIYNMIRRYNQIKDFIDTNDRDLTPYLLSPADNLRLIDYENELKSVDDITIALQGADSNLEDARIQLDGAMQLNLMKDQIARTDSNGNRIITTYGQWDIKYLKTGCSIARNPDFESGIVKILRKEEAALTIPELDAIESLKNNNNHAEARVTFEDTGNYAQNLRNVAKRSKLSKATYIDLRFIPSTSVVAERAFSTSGLVYNELRQALTPYHLECVLFLKHNHLFWNELIVAQVFVE